jgi:molybdate transport system ATP-binding protein
MLSVDITHRLGRFGLDVHFSSDGALTALFGRSGAGKTSVVNAIAGLIRPDAGRVAVNGAVLVDTERGIFVPRHKRRIGYVFQEGRLFPHLTVRQNLLFGRWFSPRGERPARIEDIVELLGIGHLLDRRPADLSGGEKQRVAIGRALLANPRLLLMDEPLASLDTRRKDEILPYIEHLRDETKVPIIYVSHSVAEVARLADTMVLMSDGKVQAVGSVAAVMSRTDLYPLTGRFEAGAVVETHVAAHDDRYGLTLLRGRAGDIKVPHLDLEVGASVRIRIRARDVMLATSPLAGISALNVLPGTVTEIAGGPAPVTEVQINAGGDVLLARVTRRSVAELQLAPGLPIFAVIKTVAIDRHSLGLSGVASVEEDGTRVVDT